VLGSKALNQNTPRILTKKILTVERTSGTFLIPIKQKEHDNNLSLGQAKYGILSNQVQPPPPSLNNRVAESFTSLIF